MRSSVTDITSGLFVLLMASLFHFQSGDLEGVSRMYPQMLIIFMTLGGLYILFQGLLKRRKGCDTESNEEPASMKRILQIAAGAIAYVLVISVLGFYVTTAVFLFGMALLLNDAGWGLRKNMQAAILLAAIMCFFVWGGFHLLLGVPTPEGILF